MLKSKNLQEVSEESRKVLVRVASNIFRKVMQTLPQCDGHELLKASMEQIGLLNDEEGVLGKDMSFSKTGSLEKRLLRCIAVKNLGREEATALICDDVDYGRTLATNNEGTSSQRFQSRRSALDEEEMRKTSSNVRRMYSIGLSD